MPGLATNFFTPPSAESSSGPSTAGSSPAAGQRKKTGRPNKWTASRQRKLARLYLYSILPPKDIPLVLREELWVPGKEAPTIWEPGEESTTKKASALLDFDPRWLRPKTREEMDKRLAGLSDCKANRKFKRKLSREYEASGGHLPVHSEIPFSDTSNAAFERFLGVLPEDPVLSMFEFPFPARQENMLQPPCNFWEQDAQFQEESILPTSRPPGLAADQISDEPLPSDQSIASTYSGLSSLRKRLPERSIPFLKGLIRLTKAHSISDSSAATFTVAAHSISTNAENGSASTVHTLSPSEPTHRVTKLLLPSSFLIVDRYKKRQGLCIKGLKPHDSKTCWCAVLAELQQESNVWVGTSGLPDGVRDPPQGLHKLDAAFHDDFGNTMLHFLAAREANFDLIVLAVKQGNVDANAQNVAGQTFLHLLHKRFLRILLSNEGELIYFLQTLNALNVRFDIPDLFGRTFFHLLTYHSRDLDQHSLGVLISNNAKLPSYRDAFGWTVTVHPEIRPRAGETHASTQNTIRNVTSGFYAYPNIILLLDSVPPSEYVSISKHARLLETARLALDAPWLEDTEGRNGLHCLAEASMRMSIKNDRVPLSKSNKRKRDQADPESFSARLILRYDLVQDMIGCGVPLNRYDKQGNTALMAFITHLRDGECDKILMNIFQHLLHRGADQHMRNLHGETSLHLAVRLGRKIATRVLLENGANVHARNAKGNGVLAVGQMAFFDARENHPLYASIVACMALVFEYGAVPAPTLVQEWSIHQGWAVFFKLQERARGQF